MQLIPHCGSQIIKLSVASALCAQLTDDELCVDVQKTKIKVIILVRETAQPCHFLRRIQMYCVLSAAFIYLQEDLLISWNNQKRPFQVLERR